MKKRFILLLAEPESDNWALIGTAMANKRAGKHIITTAIEHAAVIQPMIYLQEQDLRVS